jgi:hypothetical protein
MEVAPDSSARNSVVELRNDIILSPFFPSKMRARRDLVI